MPQIIKVVKKTNSKIEQAKTLLSVFCLLSDIRLSDTDLTVLSYFLVYGAKQETRDLIVKSSILNQDSLRNTVSRLNKFGLVKKSLTSKEYELSEKINVQPDGKLGMFIQIDNT